MVRMLKPVGMTLRYVNRCRFLSAAAQGWGALRACPATPALCRAQAQFLLLLLLLVLLLFPAGLCSLALPSPPLRCWIALSSPLLCFSAPLACLPPRLSACVPASMADPALPSSSSPDPRVLHALHLLRQANKLTKLSLFNWSPDWAAATPLYEQAASAFKLAKMLEESKTCYEKAATGQERLSSPWTAGKHMESAGALAKELGRTEETVDLYRRASELFLHCGKVQPSADVLGRGARAVEDEKPETAVRMYLDACAMLEEDGREQMAFDTYRAAVNLYIKLDRFKDAAAVLVRWGQSADKCHAAQSQCKAYLSAIIVHLCDEDLKQAQKCYNDCSQINAFLRSDQGETAEKLLSAYCGGSPDEIKHVVSSSYIIPHLDHMIVRLAKQLPKGELKAVSGVEPCADDLNEEDLT